MVQESNAVERKGIIIKLFEFRIEGKDDKTQNTGDNVKNTEKSLLSYF